MADRYLSEEQAANLWKRAAELEERAREQAEAELRRDPDLLPGGMPGEVSWATARQAAVEAGIAGRMVDRAALELAAEGNLDPDTASPRARALLGATHTTFTMTRVFAAPLADLRRAIDAVTDTPAYTASLVELIEQDSTHAALVYEIPAALETAAEAGTFHYQVRAVAEIKRFALLLSETEDHKTEVTVQVALGRSIRVNAIALRLIRTLGGAGVGAGAGFAASALVGASALAGGPAAPIIVGAALAAGALGPAALVTRLYRRAYDNAYRKLDDAFGRLLTAVRVKLG